MSLSPIVIPDMPELYYAALRALEYREISPKNCSESSSAPLRHGIPPTLSHRKRIRQHGVLSGWLHNVFSYFAVRAFQGHAPK